MTNSVADLKRSLESLMDRRPGQWTWSACGVSRTLQSIPTLLDRDAYNLDSLRVRLLLVAGLSPGSNGPDFSKGALEGFLESGAADHIALSMIPGADIDPGDFNSGSAGSSTRDLSVGYPPEGNFYYDADAPERRYLWRWICFQAPDLVLELRFGDAVRWEANEAGGFLPLAVGASRMPDDDSLLSALGRGTPDGLGPIPGLRITVGESGLSTELGRLWDAIGQARSWPAAPARQELDRRRFRPYLQVAEVLASAYGHDLDTVVYTKGVAISGRLRLDRLAPAANSSTDDIRTITDPFLDGVKNAFGDQPASSTIGGLVWAYDLARHQGDQRAADLVLRAAAHFRPTGTGSAPTATDPDFRVEDMFNCNAMLGRAYRLSGDTHYLDLMANFLLDAGTQQENGLFWHCRSAPYFWGRGNGFAALGFAETLTYLPEDHPKRASILQMHLKHLDALRQLQQPSGMYWQMLDIPGSYQEFTCTCMIGYAMARGLRRGWLDPSFQDFADLAWRGVSQRIDDAGSVVDACISTGVQQSVKEYLDRPAIFGPDDRSGALALWFAVEMERLRRNS